MGTLHLFDMELSGITDWSTEREHFAEEIAPCEDAVKSTGLLHVDTLSGYERPHFRLATGLFTLLAIVVYQIKTWVLRRTLHELNYHVAEVIDVFPSPIRGRKCKPRKVRTSIALAIYKE